MHPLANRAANPDKIPPNKAWAEFKHDWTRLFDKEDAQEGNRNMLQQFVHIITGQWVNLTRVAGIADRDASQNIGRGLNAVMWLAILYGIISAL